MRGADAVDRQNEGRAKSSGVSDDEDDGKRAVVNTSLNLTGETVKAGYPDVSEHSADSTPKEHPYPICEGCRRRVDPADAHVLRAVELVKVGTRWETTVAEERGAYFHLSCWPGEGSGYRLKPRSK